MSSVLSGQKERSEFPVTAMMAAVVAACVWKWLNRTCTRAWR